jgi:cellulose synthase/poly-beta-1,6-N-acetylglucosamine synthase-like glycosyltransferase
VTERFTLVTLPEVSIAAPAVPTQPPEVGEFLVFLDAGVTLADGALDALTAAVDADPDADVLYGNEDTVSATGSVIDTFLKPSWSPERLRCQNYIGGLFAVRQALVSAAGHARRGLGGAELYDLALRVTERANQIVHIPQVLCHRAPSVDSGGFDTAQPAESGVSRQARQPGRDQGPDSGDTALVSTSSTDERCLTALREHCTRIGLAAEVSPGATPGTFRVTRTGSVDGLVSVIIPTRGDAARVLGARRVFVVEAVRSLVAKSGEVPLEIVIVYDPPTPQAVLDDLTTITADAGARLVLVPYDKPFSFSEKCNIGVAASSGSFLLQLNDDVEILSDDFVTQLVLPLTENINGEHRVGATGAKLLYPDDTIQHAGVVTTFGGPAHALRGRRDDGALLHGALAVNREVTALTGACLALRRETWEDVGGFSETLPVNYNDTDLCLKIARSGQRILWLANVRAYHFESKSRNASVETWEWDRFRARWGFGSDTDPYLPQPANSRLRRLLTGTR